MAVAYPTMQVINKNGKDLACDICWNDRKHSQEWQARVWFQEALQVYARDQARQD